MKLSFELLNLRQSFMSFDTFKGPIILGFICYQFYYGEGFYGLIKCIYGRLDVIMLLFFFSLFQYWPIEIKSRIKYYSGGHKLTKEKIRNYKFCRVQLNKQQYSYSEIVDIIEVENKEEINSHSNKQYWIIFMENRYIYDEAKESFIKVKPNSKFNLKNLEKHQRSYGCGINTLYQPINLTHNLLNEQSIQPLSLLQIFSVFLWLQDESTIYALFTMFMLYCQFCSAIQNRITILQNIRDIYQNPQLITVYRDNQWRQISSQFLDPGEVVILQTAEKIKPDENYMTQFLQPQQADLFQNKTTNVDSYKYTPCDILLLNGQAIVNESMLTMDNVPQVKEGINQNQNEYLDIKEKHKSNVIFCGSEIIQLKGNTQYPSYINNDENQSECLGLVLRTGFSTAKGKFMKTMLYNNQDVNRKQIGELFIALFLLIFASIASAYIFINCFQEESRNKYYLFIRCLLIITTVVPFLLPMILSITVQDSLELFEFKKIFCTQSSKIPLAAKEFFWHLIKLLHQLIID
ncbi:unnamed protein product [Paramecium pentaurelia]|uniref:Uncharacterized protein n=1 Tax=Paramecium pentaurelia TaxID=43138 RepID=A0A8S1S5E3_9CILI|nr:unnamed protein product [Paramecium pentaurelia]